MTSATSNAYFFRAVTAAGSRTLGVRQAGSPAQLADDLRKEQMILVRAWKLPGLTGMKQKVPLRDEVALNEQLSVLLSRGVPLVEALEVAATVVRQKLRGKVNRLCELVAAGSSFADACDKVGGFDEVTISVYRAGERTGDLGGAAERLAKAARRRLAVAGKAVTLMIYPAIVCILSFIMVTAMILFIVPMIGEQLQSGGVELPTYSKIVIGFGVWARAHLPIVLLALVGLAMLVIGARKSIGAFIGRLARRIPLMSNLLLTSELARFFSVMAAMTRSGVPLADAMDSATGVISDPKLREQFAWLRRSLVEGGVLRSLIERVDRLPLATRRLLIAAERSGDLDQAFDALADDMADSVDTYSSRLLAWLEPVLLLGMFAIIGPLLLAIAIPLLSIRSSGM